MVTEQKSETRVRKPAHVSRITTEQKRELVKLAVEMAQKRDFSGISAMAELEKLMPEAAKSAKKRL